RDVEWTDAGVGGAFRFVQRVWRLVGQAATAPARGGSNAPSEPATALRRAAHRALAGVDEDLAALRFNVAIAKMYELVNAITAASEEGANAVRDPTLVAARRAAIELLVHVIAPIMPH